MLIFAPKATDPGRFEARKMYPQYLNEVSSQNRLRALNDKNIFISPGIKPRHPQSIREGVISSSFQAATGAAINNSEHGLSTEPVAQMEFQS